MNILKKLAKILCVTVISVIALLLIIKVGEKIVYFDFYSNAQREFKIPGLSDGFVPQGLDYDADSSKYLTCGYSTKGASCVYIVDEKGGGAVKCELKNADGTDYTGHTGGIAHSGDYVYITAEDGLDVFRYSDIMSGGSAAVTGTFKTGIDPAYCHIEDGCIYIGSFYREGNYETPARERITTPSGDENTSLIEVYELDASAEYGIITDAVCGYSAPGLVQGMCFDENGRMVLSTSYGFASSHLYVYDCTAEPSGEIEINGSVTNLFYLDSGSLVETVKAPPMSEEIILRDGRIIIMTESASNKYVFGKFMSGNYAYGIRL